MGRMDEEVMFQRADRALLAQRPRPAALPLHPAGLDLGPHDLLRALVEAVIERGFQRLAGCFAEFELSADPVADMAGTRSLTTRRQERTRTCST